MRLIFGLVLVVGLALAGFAVYMARDFIGTYEVELASERAKTEQMVKTIPVYVVERSVRYGEQLTKADVRLVDWPENAIPEGAFTKPVLTIDEYNALVEAGTPPVDPMFPEGEKSLRTVLRTMEKDEAVLAVKVTEPGEDAGVSSRLSEGMRAFALQVDVSTGVSGFLRPGDRVDVYWTGRVVQADSFVDVTKLIQAGVRLIAIDQIADEDRNNPVIARTVTVEVTPNQVAALAQAQSTGRLSLALLGNNDTTVAGSVEVDQRSLLGIVDEEPEEQVVVVEEPQICTIRTRRGADIVETPIPCPN